MFCPAPNLDAKDCEGLSERSRSAPSLRAAVRIVIRGQVQGVGFRPFVYRLAETCHLGGIVRNASTGVVIEAEGLRKDILHFQKRLVREVPAGAEIDALTVQPLPLSGRAGFGRSAAAVDRRST